MTVSITITLNILKTSKTYLKLDLWLDEGWAAILSDVVEPPPENLSSVMERLLVCGTGKGWLDILNKEPAPLKQTNTSNINLQITIVFCN